MARLWRIKGQGKGRTSSMPVSCDSRQCDHACSRAHCSPGVAGMDATCTAGAKPMLLRLPFFVFHARYVLKLANRNARSVMFLGNIGEQQHICHRNIQTKTDRTCETDADFILAPPSCENFGADAHMMAAKLFLGIKIK